MASERISTGRGGAGNVRPTAKIDLPDKTDELPKIQGKRFTTGRGGAGNMMDNIDPDSTRAAQGEGLLAEESPGHAGGALAPSTSMTVGRGGYGNNIRAMNSRNQPQEGSEDGASRSLCERISNLFA